MPRESSHRTLTEGTDFVTQYVLNPEFLSLSLIPTLYFSYSLHNLLLPQLKHQHLHRQNFIMAVGKRGRGQDPCKHYVVICDYALTCTCIHGNMYSTLALLASFILILITMCVHAHQSLSYSDCVIALV